MMMLVLYRITDTWTDTDINIVIVLMCMVTTIHNAITILISYVVFSMMMPRMKFFRLDCVIILTVIITLKR
jgi:hypothetical protein